MGPSCHRHPRPHHQYCLRWRAIAPAESVRPNIRLAHRAFDGHATELQPIQERSGQKIVQGGRPARHLEPIKLIGCDHNHRLTAIHGDPLRLPRRGTAHDLAQLGLRFPQLPNRQRRMGSDRWNRTCHSKTTLRLNWLSLRPAAAGRQCRVSYPSSRRLSLQAWKAASLSWKTGALCLVLWKKDARRFCCRSLPKQFGPVLHDHIMTNLVNPAPWCSWQSMTGSDGWDQATIVGAMYYNANGQLAKVV